MAKQITAEEVNIYTDDNDRTRTRRGSQRNTSVKTGEIKAVKGKRFIDNVQANANTNLLKTIFWGGVGAVIYPTVPTVIQSITKTDWSGYKGMITGLGTATIVGLGTGKAEIAVGALSAAATHLLYSKGTGMIEKATGTPIFRMNPNTVIYSGDIKAVKKETTKDYVQSVLEQADTKALSDPMVGSGVNPINIDEIGKLLPSGGQTWNSDEQPKNIAVQPAYTKPQPAPVVFPNTPLQLKPVVNTNVKTDDNYTTSTIYEYGDCGCPEEVEYNHNEKIKFREDAGNNTYTSGGSSSTYTSGGSGSTSGSNSNYVSTYDNEWDDPNGPCNYETMDTLMAKVKIEKPHAAARIDACYRDCGGKLSGYSNIMCGWVHESLAPLLKELNTKYLGCYFILFTKLNSANPTYVNQIKQILYPTGLLWSAGNSNTDNNKVGLITKLSDKPKKRKFYL